eukprot:UN09003
MKLKKWKNREQRDQPIVDNVPPIEAKEAGHQRKSTDLLMKQVYAGEKRKT